MADEFDFLDEPEAPLAPPEPSKELTRREAQLERIREIEDDIFLQSLQLTGDIMDFSAIDEEAEGPPEDWIMSLGLEAATRKFRHAKAAWKNSREAPIALSLGVNMAKSISKARSAERAAPKALAILLLPAAGFVPEDDMEVIDVESD